MENKFIEGDMTLDLEYDRFLPIEESDEMLSVKSTIYEIYTHFFTKVKNGERIVDTDFVFKTARGAYPYNEQQRVVAAIAVIDQKDGNLFKSKSELEQEVERLLK